MLFLRALMCAHAVRIFEPLFGAMHQRAARVYDRGTALLRWLTSVRLRNTVCDTCALLL